MPFLASPSNIGKSNHSPNADSHCLSRRLGTGTTPQIGIATAGIGTNNLPNTANVKKLRPPDSFHLSATEANAELERITPANQLHPAVQEVRWHLCAKAKDWAACVQIAQSLVNVVPERPFGWIHRSFALHELKRTPEARDLLLPAADRFPAETLIRYNLACYECQLGRLAEARRWFKRALALGDPGHMKAMALDDPDLEPLRDEIAKL